MGDDEGIWKRIGVVVASVSMQAYAQELELMGVGYGVMEKDEQGSK